MTQIKAGKLVALKYAAKNANDLRQKHPEVHKLYQKYNTAMPAIKIQFAPKKQDSAKPVCQRRP
ncbi:hypothetical protein CA13_57780 [Planctomycetes bacterium CA13]|uniref:Uncharacterized protein n=1 Tax=Novipirellula herctigrandis TaxID=2527986 RepID=A0A5C5ZBS2_9BACT|nr:hypothetical protein CA13_57780 [Planctomycetes bacterium CA13]